MVASAAFHRPKWTTVPPGVYRKPLQWAILGLHPISDAALHRQKGSAANSAWGGAVAGSEPM